MKTRMDFEVRLRVPLKSLETLLGFVDDLECKLLCTPTLRIEKPVAPSVQPSARQDTAKQVILDCFTSQATKQVSAKKVIVDTIKSSTKPFVARRELVKALRANGFRKNSIGPLCSEMKKQGIIINAQRGYWSLPDKIS